MKISKPTKNEVLVFITLLACIEAIVYIILPRNHNSGLIFSYTILIGSFCFLSGWIIGRDRKNGVLEFLKILLPASATLIATIWLLNTGYLNLRAENLKKEIRNLETKDSTIQANILDFAENKKRLLSANDSLSQYNEDLKLSINKYPYLEKEFSKQKIENNSLKKENLLLKEINEVSLQRHILGISNINYNEGKVYFQIVDQRMRVMDFTEIGIECTYDKTGYFALLEFDKKLSKYFWIIPQDFLRHRELIRQIEFNFSFNNSHSNEFVTNFRKNNSGFTIGTFNAEYQLMIFR